MKSRRVRVLALLAALAAAVGVAVTVLPASADQPADEPAAAPRDACFTFDRALGEGANGEDVRQLQIRVSGYPATGEVLGLDGDFGPATKAAVTRFQQAYGLSASGTADQATFDKIYELSDDDCSPVNFDFGELNNCNADWSGGKVDAAAAKGNALVTMWKLQAMRHAMGDAPIVVNGGFRSVACNDSVGGAANSRHLYGDAADLGAGSQGFCGLAQEARNHGFSEILGPGYPDHDDHTHVANRADQFWSAPNCGI